MMTPNKEVDDDVFVDADASKYIDIDFIIDADASKDIGADDAKQRS